MNFNNLLFSVFHFYLNKIYYPSPDGIYVFIYFFMECNLDFGLEH